MTIDITDQLRRIVYAGNDTTGPFSFPFEVINETDLGVYVNSTLLTITSDYTVSLNADGTGSITLVIGATLSDEPTSSDSIGIFGNKGIQRQTDFTTGGDLFANSLNDEFDAQTIFAQQNSEAILRSIRAPITDPTNIDMLLPAKDDRKGTLLAFDSTTGNPTVGITLGDAATLQDSLDDIALVADLEDGTISTNAVSYIGDNQVGFTTLINNISDINRYAEEYKIQASEPSSPSEGDLWYSTTDNVLFYYDGTVWQPSITSLSGDLTPELGGDLNTNDYSIIFGSTSGEKLTISNNGSVSTIASGGTTNLSITAGNYITFAADGQTAATLQGDADSTFYHTGTARLTIQSTGIDVNGDVGGDTLSISGNGTVSGNLTVTGNLQVDGTTTTINTTTLDVEDKNITIAKNSANASVADGAGITVDLGTNDPVIANPTITYNSTDDDWEFNKGLDVTGNIVVSGTVDGVDIQTLNTTAGSALQNLVEDTSPQLGGTLDLNSNGINGYGTIEAWGSTTTQDEVVTSISMIDKANGTGDTGKIVFEAMGRPDSTFNEEYPDLYIKQYVSGTTDALRPRIKLQGSTGYINFYDANGNETFVYNNEGRINSTKQITSEEAFYANNGGGSTIGTLLAGASEVSLGSTSSNDVKFLVGNLEKARLTTDGYLGIGESTPDTKLHINETGASTNNTTKTLLTLEHYPSTTPTTGFGSEILFKGKNPQNGSSLYGSVAAVWEGTSGAGAGGTLQFKTDGYYGGNTTRMTIDSQGQVGIGTTTPASELDVNGTVRATRFTAYDTGSVPFTYVGGSSHASETQIIGGETWGGVEGGTHVLGYAAVLRAGDYYYGTDRIRFGGSVTCSNNSSAGHQVTIQGGNVYTGVTDFSGGNIQIIGGQSSGTASGGSITFKTYDGTGNTSGTTLGTLTTALTIDQTGTSTFGNDIKLGDGDKAIFGAGSDLQIYHDGNNSVIHDAGTGNLLVGATGATYFNNSTWTKTAAVLNADGESSLYFNNSKKLATTSTGIDVTGTVTADGLDLGDSSLTATNTIAKLYGGSSTSYGSQLRFYDGATLTTTVGHDKSIFGGSSSDYSIYATTGNGVNAYTGGAYKRLNIASNGDISFYEDTGTTAKFFWDASAESLGIGTSSPQGDLDVVGEEYIRAGSDGVAGAGGVLWLTHGTQSSVRSAKIEAQTTGSNDNALAFYTNAAYAAPVERMRIDSSGYLKYDSGYGSVATAYGCRAWVNFNGTGTVAIRDSGNVSSITDNGTGTYTVNFTTSMPDANYAICTAYNTAVTNTATHTHYSSESTSSYRLNHIENSSAVDSAYMSSAIFR